MYLWTTTAVSSEKSNGLVSKRVTFPGYSLKNESVVNNCLKKKHTRYVVLQKIPEHREMITLKAECNSLILVLRSSKI